MKLLFILTLITTASFAQPTAQVENFRDISGQPFFPKQYQDVNGTPYLFEDWVPSKIVLTNGGAINNIKTNFNLVTEELLYVDEKGKTMVASPAIIRIVETNSETPRKFIPTPAKNTWCEVISSEGKATLLKHSRKVIFETKPFNSATSQKNFMLDESTLVSVDGNLTEVKSSDDLFRALSAAQSLKEFAKKERLKAKSELSWVRIVDRFNSDTF